MYIKSKCVAQWWGKDVLLTDMNQVFYILSDIEVTLLECIELSVKLDVIMDLFASRSKLTKKQAGHFIDCFTIEYGNCFEIGDEGDSKFIIYGKKGKFYPSELHISLTNACPLRCKHCYKEAGEGKVRYIDEKTLCLFLDKFSGNTNRLTISGGDPILHPQFDYLINTLSKKFSIDVLISGFVGIDGKIELIKRAKCSIGVSLYGASKDKHESFTQVGGSFEALMRTIEDCVKNEIPISVTLFKKLLSEEELEIAKVLLKNKGVRNIQYGKIANVGRALKFSDELFGSTLQSRFKHTSKVQKKIVERVTDPFMCAAGSIIWSIYETGEIQPCGICRRDDFKIGTIYSFDDSIIDDRKSYISRIKQTQAYKERQKGLCLLNCEEY